MRCFPPSISESISSRSSVQRDRSGFWSNLILSNIRAEVASKVVATYRGIGPSELMHPTCRARPTAESPSSAESPAASADPSAVSAEGEAASTEARDTTANTQLHPLLQHPLRWLTKLIFVVLGKDFFDEFEPWLKWKVYDVLFALSVVLLGRRLSRCPRAQRLLDFVSES